MKEVYKSYILKGFPVNEDDGLYIKRLSKDEAEEIEHFSNYSIKDLAPAFLYYMAFDVYDRLADGTLDRDKEKKYREEARYYASGFATLLQLLEE